MERTPTRLPNAQMLQAKEELHALQHLFASGSILSPVVRFMRGKRLTRVHKHELDLLKFDKHIIQ